MQTFLPYADFDASAAVLDDRRLGKQRVETLQILRALVYPSYRGWRNHPATKMWRGFTAALVAYGVAVCDEWVRRGNADAVLPSLLVFTGGTRPDVDVLRRAGALPPWLGLAGLHVSHRSALVRKDPAHYRALFPDVPDDLPYLWPPAVFPRWPVHHGGSPMPLEVAVRALGWREPRPVQATAVALLREGRDVVLDLPYGSGATSTGLLAALCLGKRTLWVPEHAGPVDETSPPVTRLRRPAAATSSGRVSKSIARPPTADDLAAVEREATAEQEFVFHRPSALTGPAVRRALRAAPPGLAVLDDVAVAAATAVLRCVQGIGDPVVLATAAVPEGALPGAERLG